MRREIGLRRRRKDANAGQGRKEQWNAGWFHGKKLSGDGTQGNAAII
jgi:hypothetical protein